MIANIAWDDALILPRHANPAGLNFRERQEIADIAENVRIPEKTLRRHLEDLQAQGLVTHISAEERRESGEETKADLWLALV